jgi:hypothetical protein
MINPHRVRAGAAIAAGAAILLVAAPSAPAAAPVAKHASARACAPVVNPYPGTRYEGDDLRRIRATRVTCRGARRVARRAHRKALSLPPPLTGVRRFTWHGWRVTGDLRPSSDRYVAKKGRKRVSWRF